MPPEYIDLAVIPLYSVLVGDKCARQNTWTLRLPAGVRLYSRLRIEQAGVSAM